MTTAATDLVALPKETALQVFTMQLGTDPYLAHIRAQVDAFVPDVSTRKGRDAIASLAYSISRSKTALDNVGKELVAEQKKVPALIDAERKRAQREREAERLKRLGHRVMQLELYQGTADALDRLCQFGDFEQPAEVITLLIHSADQIAQRDPSRFAELVSVTRHEVTTSENAALKLAKFVPPEDDE